MSRGRDGSSIGPEGTPDVPGVWSRGERVGRYELVEAPGGFEIHETRSPLVRWVEALFRDASRPRIRLGALRDGPSDHPIESVSGVVVRRRRLRGPAAKPTATRRPWEACLVDVSDEELHPRFHFRREAEAERFAEAVRRRLPGHAGGAAE